MENCGITYIFVGYSVDCAYGVYRMLNLNTKRRVHPELLFGGKNGARTELIF
jgi:hypothetical protein